MARRPLVFSMEIVMLVGACRLANLKTRRSWEIVVLPK
jgi:hypothetical protein